MISITLPLGSAIFALVCSVAIPSSSVETGDTHRTPRAARRAANGLEVVATERHPEMADRPRVERRGLVGPVVQGDLHAEEPDVLVALAGPGRFAPEGVHVEVPGLDQISHRNGEMEDRLHPLTLGRARGRPQRRIGGTHDRPFIAGIPTGSLRVPMIVLSCRTTSPCSGA